MNWTSLDEAAVRAGKNSLFLDTMQATATGKGEPDPLPQILGGVTARIRAAISSGNQLDVDPSKIPNSLVDLALGMVTRRIKSYLEYALTPDDLEESKADRLYLAQISADKVRFETPDVPAGEAEMQSAGGYVDLVEPGNCGNSRWDLRGL